MARSAATKTGAASAGPWRSSGGVPDTVTVTVSVGAPLVSGSGSAETLLNWIMYGDLLLNAGRSISEP